jgi:hypothetical protein
MGLVVVGVVAAVYAALPLKATNMSPEIRKLSAGLPAEFSGTEVIVQLFVTVAVDMRFPILPYAVQGGASMGPSWRSTAPDITTPGSFEKSAVAVPVQGAAVPFNETGKLIVAVPDSTTCSIGQLI